MKLPKQVTFVLVASIVLCPVGSANAAVAPVVYLPKAEDAKTGNRLQLPGPWGNTVKGLRCRITELALAEQRFTVEIQNQSDKPIGVIAAAKSGRPDYIGLEWALYDLGEPPNWEKLVARLSEPDHVVLQPGESHHRTSRVARTPGCRLKVRCATSLNFLNDRVEFIETRAVELPTSLTVAAAPKSAKVLVWSTAARRPIREEEDILDYATSQKVSLRLVMPVLRKPFSAGSDLERSEAEFRKFIAELPKPRIVSRLLKLYREENDAARKLDLLRVLALSRDPRTAVAIGEREVGSRFSFEEYRLMRMFLTRGETMHYIGGVQVAVHQPYLWWKKHEKRIRAAAAELEKRAGQTLPQKSDNGDSPPADKPDATPPRNLDVPQTQRAADKPVAGVAASKLPALPGPWGRTVKGLRCRITELALAEQRFTVEIQNQSDKPIRVITAPKSGRPDSIGLEWAFYDPGKPPRWVSIAWAQTEPVEPGHVVLEPGKSHYRTSGVYRTPGSRFKVRWATSLSSNYDLVEFVETGAVELPTSVSVTGISGNTGRTGKQAVGEELSDKSFTGPSRPIREEEDILDYVTTQNISLRWVMPIIVVEGSPEEVLKCSEESFRKFIAELPKPRTVSKLLKLYGEEDDAARKLDLKRVLKLSRDPRAGAATGPWNDILVFPYPDVRRGQAELERFSALLRKTRIERADDLLRQMLEQAPPDAVRNYLKDLREKDRAASRNASSLFARLAEIGRLNETTAPDFLQKASEGRDVDAICISLFVLRNEVLQALAADRLRDLADPRAVRSLAIRLQLADSPPIGGAPVAWVRGQLRRSLMRALSSCTGITVDLRNDGEIEFLQKCKAWLVANGRDQAASSNRRSDTRATAFIVFQYPDVKKRPAELDRFMDSIATVTDDNAHRLLRRMAERVPVNDVAAYLEKKSTSASRKTTRGKAAFLLARLRELLSLDWQTMPAFLEEAEAKGEFDATCVLLLGARAQGLSALAAESLSKAAHPDAARCVAIGLQFAACRPTGGTEQQLEQLHLRYRLVEALSSATGIDTSSFDGTGAGACHILVAAKNWMEKRKAD